MNTRVLLLDAGNTRLKWAVLEWSEESSSPATAAWLTQGAARYDALEELPAHWQQCGALSACHGVSVAGDDVNSAVQTRLASIALVPHWHLASAAACGVENRYQPPMSLGADRWAALIGARQRTRDACLVVSAGTALTIDALTADGQFIGGVIIPGLHGMRQALARSTARVGEQYGTLREFPDNTADAVETGLVMALTGVIEKMNLRLAQSGTPVHCLLTGGDAALLQAALPTPAEVIPSLVLEGVYHLAKGFK
ncbi:MAG: type III pantothenate kinase [Thiobacillaceae bacterium]